MTKSQIIKEKEMKKNIDDKKMKELLHDTPPLDFLWVLLTTFDECPPEIKKNIIDKLEQKIGFR
jgi:hypothetical protein